MGQRRRSTPVYSTVSHGGGCWLELMAHCSSLYPAVATGRCRKALTKGTCKFTAGLSAPAEGTSKPAPPAGSGRSGYSADVIAEGEAVANQGTVAVVVLSHRGPAQIARLVSRLQDGRDTFVLIHHDPNGEALTLRPSSTVALVPDPVPCPWGLPGIN